MSRRNRPRPIATPAPAESEDDDENDDVQNDVTEKSPLKPSGRAAAAAAASSPTEGGTTTRERRARRRTGNDETELVSHPPASPEPARERRRGGEDEPDEAASEGEADGSADDASVAATSPPAKAKSPGRLRGLLKGRKKPSRKEGDGGGDGGDGGSGDEGDAAADADGQEEGGKKRQERKEARREAPSSRQVERVGPVLTRPAELAKAQATVLYRPRLSWWRDASARSLQAAEQQAREEGFYVKPLPRSTPRSLQLLDLRLGSHGEGGEAEGEEGAAQAAARTPRHVPREPDPVRHVWVRPAHTRQPRDAKLATQRGRASVQRVDGASRPSGSQHSLQVSIGGLQLHDHPLFLREHSLQRQLRGLAEQLAVLREREALDLYAHKVSELSSAVRQMDAEMHRSSADDDAGGGGEALARKRQRLSALCIELLGVRVARDEHECAERLLARRMLRLWHQIKEERRAHGFVATRAKLQVQLLAADDADDAAELERQLDEEAYERQLVRRLAQAVGGAPHAYDADKVRAEIEQRQAALRRPPGEQPMLPIYSEHSAPTELVELKPQVRRRQLDAHRTRLYCVMLVDGALVGTTGPMPLHPHDFCTRFDCTMLLQLLAAPRNLTLQLWQRRLSGFSDVMLAETFIAVPDVASPPTPHWQQYSFSSEKPFVAARLPAATAAAARDRDDDDDDDDDGGKLAEVTASDQRYIGGQLAVAVAWAAQPASVARGPAPRRAPQPGTLSSGALDVTRMRQHVHVDDLDPNAPQDVPLLSLLARADRRAEGGAFRPGRLARELLWRPSWAQTDRTRLLELRRSKPSEWQRLPQGKRAVPTRDAEIPIEMRELLKPSDPDDDDDEQAAAAQKQPSKVRAWISQVLSRQQSAQAGRQFLRSTRDFVREPLLEIEVEPFTFDVLLNKLEPRRKLLPRRTARKPEPGSVDVPRKVEVVVQAGIDLPVREGAAPATKPVVEVRFQGQSVLTEVKAGANPIWNQIILLDMTTDDWSQKALLDLPDEISFNLFDQIRRSERDEREANVRVQRDERRWLGGFSLPFSTLYRSGKVEGSFPLNLPPILLGYEKDDQSPSSKQQLVPSSALRLFATVEPALPPPKDKERERVSTRDAKMQEAAAAWVKKLLAALPKEQRFQRHLRVFAPADSGEMTLVCNFVRPQPPPEELRTEQALLRFVSLVPFLDDAALGAKLDVWNTSRSFLELCAGDSEEHALLLCNYLLTLSKYDKEAYVVLGTGIPEGQTAYVLTKGMAAREHRLWNASSGRVYALTDLSLPLHSVACVFNGDNVWANVQPTDKPASLEWSFGDSAQWRPFFGKGGYPPTTLQSVQDAHLRYRRTSEDHRKDVEREVEDTLQRAIEDRRGHRPTDWNRSVAAKLRPLLRRFEEDANGTKHLTEEEHNAALERVRATYQLVGFPINMSFTDMQPLVDKILNTNIWQSDGPGMQFVLATYVHAYPNNICSVWVYIASLEDMRAGSTARTE